jgi:hypothetical protein
MRRRIHRRDRESPVMNELQDKEELHSEVLSEDGSVVFESKEEFESLPSLDDGSDDPPADSKPRIRFKAGKKKSDDKDEKNEAGGEPAGDAGDTEPAGDVGDADPANDAGGEEPDGDADDDVPMEILSDEPASKPADLSFGVVGDVLDRMHLPLARYGRKFQNVIGMAAAATLITAIAALFVMPRFDPQRRTFDRIAAEAAAVRAVEANDQQSAETPADVPPGPVEKLPPAP